MKNDLKGRARTKNKKQQKYKVNVPLNRPKCQSGEEGNNQVFISQ